MGRLLSGNAPLRDRAGLELVVCPLDHQLAAQFWDIADPRLALQVHAIVGGTPAYRREFARGDSPSGPDDFNDWVVVCRDRTLHQADPELVGGLPARVGHGVVHDRTARTGHEVDVAVVGVADGDGKPPLLAIGEAKWNDTMGIAHIERLRHIRDLIAQSGCYDTRESACFASAARASTIRLISRPRAQAISAWSAWTSCMGT